MHADMFQFQPDIFHAMHNVNTSIIFVYHITAVSKGFKVIQWCIKIDEKIHEAELLGKLLGFFFIFFGWKAKRLQDWIKSHKTTWGGGKKVKYIFHVATCILFI